MKIVNKRERREREVEEEGEWTERRRCALKQINQLIDKIKQICTHVILFNALKYKSYQEKKKKNDRSSTASHFRKKIK